MEKNLGISGHKAITEYGIAKFNEDCRSIVLRYTSQWKKIIDKMINLRIFVDEDGRFNRSLAAGSSGSSSFTLVVSLSKAPH